MAEKADLFEKLLKGALKGNTNTQVSQLFILNQPLEMDSPQVEVVLFSFFLDKKVPFMLERQALARHC